MVDDRPVPATHTEGETLDLPEGVQGFRPGQVLGERYEIRGLLGRGGMGEVWHAFDLKLRVEVALKALRPEFFRSERRLKLLRDEVRAAREVVSPNVCRIFDLIEIDGRELVSMEYVDGATLLAVLTERGPLELKVAQDVASQFLAGLEAIHKVGLVHRDIKPENIMLTRAGRVVVMDFGLARQEAEGGGSVSGTPAYMSPEQAAGQTLDARADVYSAGVVLAEMVCPGGITDLQSRQSVWEGLRSEPAKVPDTPWAAVIKKAVAKDRDARFNTAHTLTRALEDVTLRVEGAEDLHPYPGLASFTEADAEYFFGREAEVEQMWRKLEGPPRLFAIMGPSGAGKTSFIRAGLIPFASANWLIIRSTPGNAATASLASVVAREMAGEQDVVELLPQFDQPDVAVRVLAAWAHRSPHALLVVDQFEELFTQNAPEEQRRFSDLLRRLVLESDVHVLLSMRDDFAASCHAFEPLRPIFHELTVLDPPAGDNLRRALTQPALQCGYRFEDDELVDEMLNEVEGERGALPLLAFAAARLWEKRGRDRGLLSRQAYHDIGGVGGALARHAEATVDRIGHERIPIVRELFRNLVTAEGTRAVREWNELLSVFGSTNEPSASIRFSGDPSTRSSDSLAQDDRCGVAEEVLRELIDARLLTSYEVREEDREPTRRVEIIHESLLANWPRLVGWRTQDADESRLRDELRQAARTWDEHDRSDDLLWTGSAYREYTVWRERYPGGLSEVEEAFTTAMTSLATRRRRRRRMAVTAFCAALLVVASVVAVLWQRSVRETRRAEAAGLLSLARAELTSYPSAGVAYATASLQLSDSEAARLLALEALWRGPPAFVASEGPSWRIRFSPDGRWLVQLVDEPPYSVRLYGADGFAQQMGVLGYRYGLLNMGADSRVFSTTPNPFVSRGALMLWSIEDGRLLSENDRGFPHDIATLFFDPIRKRIVLIRSDGDVSSVESVDFEGKTKRLGVLPFDIRSVKNCREPTASWMSFQVDDGVYVTSIGDRSLSKPRRIGEVSRPATAIACDSRGRFVATRAESGLIKLWNLDGSSPPKVISGPSGGSDLKIFENEVVLQAEGSREMTIDLWIWSLESHTPKLLRQIELGKHGGIGGWTPDPSGSKLVSIVNPDPYIRVWSLRSPADSEPMILRRGEAGANRMVAFDPSGEWLAVSGTDGLTLWAIERPYPVEIERYEERVGNLVFGPGGRTLATSSFDGRGSVRLWNLDDEGVPRSQVLYSARPHAYGIAASPDGNHVLVGTQQKGARLLSVSRNEDRGLPGSSAWVLGVAFSPSGRYAAAHGHGLGVDGSSRWIQVWDLTKNELVRSLASNETGLYSAHSILFMDDDHLLSGGRAGLRIWDLTTGNVETLYRHPIDRFSFSSNENRVLVSKSGSTMGSLSTHGSAAIFDLDSGIERPLSTHGERITAVAISEDGNIVATGTVDGVIRVGHAGGGEPHVLLRDSDEVFDLAIDPTNRWIAVASGTQISLWPMPDLSKPPLHTLPREELIAKLKTLTNLRVVRDPGSATGWKLTHDPLPGWQTVPTW